jgi:hypothetical protein
MRFRQFIVDILTIEQLFVTPAKAVSATRLYAFPSADLGLYKRVYSINYMSLEVSNSIPLHYMVV